MLRQRDVALAVGASWLATILSTLAPGRAMVAIPFALLLLAPGFALSALAFPSGTAANGERPVGSLHPVERVGVSFLMAVGLVPLLAIALQMAGVGWWPTTYAVSAAVVTTLAGALAMRRTPERARWPDGWLPSNARLPLFAVAAGVVALGAIAATVLPEMSSDRPFSEALLLPRSGHVTELGAPVPAGVPLEYVVQVVNHEGADEIYGIEWSIAYGGQNATTGTYVPQGRTAQGATDLHASAGSRVNATIAVPALDVGLYRLDVLVTPRAHEARPLHLHAWIEVRA